MKTARDIVESVVDVASPAYDASADFVEEEVGRHDWVRNWDWLKSNRDVLGMAKDFVSRTGHTASPEDIVSTVDAMTSVGKRYHG